MKKLILMLSLCFAMFDLHGQIYTLPSVKLASQFAEIYKKSDKKENYYPRISVATEVFFSIENEQFHEVIRDLQKKYKLSVDSAANIVFDTVMRSFIRYHLWDEYPGQQEKFLSFFQLYNNKLCPCIGEKIKQSPLHRMEEKDMANCIGNLTLDTGYINGMRRSIGNLTMNEIYEVSQLAGMYMYQHCDALYNYFTEVNRDMYLSAYLFERRNHFFDLDKTVIQLYSKRSTELPKFFPDYKNYEAAIRSANTIVNKDGVCNFHDRTIDASGKLSIIKTFYRCTSETPVLYGQLVYTLKEESPDAPILSWQFTTGEKMKDRDKYLKQIKDEAIEEPSPPPPPIEMIKEVRIDTIRKN